MKVERTLTLTPGPTEVFSYLADFTTNPEWDPAGVRTTLISGDGGVGTTYLNVSTFRGKEATMLYAVTEYDAGRKIVLRGENKSVIAVDTLTFRPAGDGGTELTYSADFTIKGPLKWFGWVAAPAFKKLGDEAEEGLLRAIG